MSAIGVVTRGRALLGALALAIAAVLIGVGQQQHATANDVDLGTVGTEVTVPLPAVASYKICAGSGDGRSCAMSKVVRNGKLTVSVQYSDAGTQQPRIVQDDGCVRLVFDDVPSGTLIAIVKGLKVHVDEEEVPTSISRDVPSAVALVEACA